MILPKHKKLVTAGCSFTKGYGLADPENNSWPALLANKLNLECVNLGQNGASNDFMIHSVEKYFSFNKCDDCFLIVAFSQLNRLTLANSFDNNVVHLTPKSKKWPALSEIIYSEFSNERFNFKKFLLDLIRTQAWFEKIKVDYILVNGINWFEKKYLDEETYVYFKQIDLSKWLNYQTMNFNEMIGLDGKFPDGHPNELGHQRIANTLAQWILESNK